MASLKFFKKFSEVAQVPAFPPMPERSMSANRRRNLHEITDSDKDHNVLLQTEYNENERSGNFEVIQPRDKLLLPVYEQYAKLYPKKVGPRTKDEKFRDAYSIYKHNRPPEELTLEMYISMTRTTHSNQSSSKSPLKKLSDSSKISSLDSDHPKQEITNSQVSNTPSLTVDAVDATQRHQSKSRSFVLMPKKGSPKSKIPKIAGIPAPQSPYYNKRMPLQDILVPEAAILDIVRSAEYTKPTPPSDTIPSNNAFRENIRTIYGIKSSIMSRISEMQQEIHTLKTKKEKDRSFRRRSVSRHNNDKEVGQIKNNEIDTDDNNVEDTAIFNERYVSTANDILQPQSSPLRQEDILRTSKESPANNSVLVGSDFSDIVSAREAMLVQKIKELSSTVSRQSNENK